MILSHIQFNKSERWTIEYDSNKCYNVLNGAPVNNIRKGGEIYGKKNYANESY